MKNIFFFLRNNPWGEFSNFWRQPIAIDGEVYKTSEHFYQAEKAAREVDRRAIMNCDTPGQARTLGHQILAKPHWDANKDIVMLTALRAKFTQWPKLKALLLSTEDAALHEDNPSDPYWGCNGEDKLGKLLMQVREELRNGSY